MTISKGIAKGISKCILHVLSDYFFVIFLLSFLQKCTIEAKLFFNEDIIDPLVSLSLICHIPLSFSDAIICWCSNCSSNFSSVSDIDVSCSEVKSFTLQMPFPTSMTLILWGKMYWNRKQNVTQISLSFTWLINQWMFVYDTNKGAPIYQAILIEIRIF